MTIVVDGSGSVIDQVCARTQMACTAETVRQVQSQLEDLVPVVVTERLTFENTHVRSFVERDLMLIKVWMMLGCGCCLASVAGEDLSKGRLCILTADGRGAHHIPSRLAVVALSSCL